MEGGPTGLAAEKLAEIVAASVVAASVLGGLRFVAALLLLWRGLRGRTDVRDARLLACFSRVSERTELSRVRLSESDHVASPLILGAAEICVPRGWLATLRECEVETVFAHELAHLERRDGLWFPLVGFVQSALWMQPLNHWLAARFRESAELACDDRAVALTDDPLSLARALTQVAANTRDAARPALLPTMAGSSSGLGVRVKRLLSSDAVSRDAPRRRAWLMASLVVVFAVAAALRVDVARARSSRTELLPASLSCSRAEPRASTSYSHVETRASTAAPAPPDAASSSIQMAELRRREIELTSKLERVQGEARERTTELSALLLELEQELRHVRATEIWIEARFVRASEAAR